MACWTEKKVIYFILFSCTLLLYGAAFAQEDICFGDSKVCYVSPPCGERGYWSLQYAQTILAPTPSQPVPTECLATNIRFLDGGVVEQVLVGHDMTLAATNLARCRAHLGKTAVLSWSLAENLPELHISAGNQSRVYSARFVKDPNVISACVMILMTDVPNLSTGRYRTIHRWVPDGGE
ncbi:hypothetical protein [Sagittula stellata]|uniref:hypothetical protein n=1 Tax=Sagittula stellata TaxID=52603 RepID=UPI0012F4D38D|nr:hypothetical protein [Sagittula stellata]